MSKVFIATQLTVAVSIKVDTATAPVQETVQKQESEIAPQKNHTHS